MSESENNTGIDIVVPDIGDSENVEVIELLVAVGDSVSVDDSLMTLESDKASMEIPASQAGVIESFTVSIGDTVNAGDVIGRLSVVSKSSTKASESEPAANSTESTPTNDIQPPAVASVAKAEPPAAAGGTPSKPAKAQGKSSGSPTAHIADADMRKAHASPGVRRYAREHGADLSLMQGSGAKGRIVKTDVMAFIKQAMEGMSSNYGSSGGFNGGGTGIPAIPEVDFSKFGEVERVELGRINKISAANLHRAWLNLPMVTHHDSADVTEMEAFRKLLKSEAKEGDAKITGLAFHMKALTKTLKAFPKVNSSLSPDGEALFYKKYFNIGIAVDTPNGLVVPVFKDVDKKSISELAAEMSDMSTRARAKKLKPDEMQGASMTISSLGGIGGTAFTPIVNPPEVAILGITRASMQPVWDGATFIPRLMCPLDLTYDHRVVDGADAARFMAHYIREISDIRRLSL
ncbi:dihydrolipoyllysine-residue acetyltransferase [Granulosicoccus sp.]|nr:dihydrolipoyllysine-residue acetyltransferase [Granulosicoccus sp.]MDB4222263.1 dihydrolipoyllysine-residue acetyltransferase [Granulosicoccus sp.]